MKLKLVTGEIRVTGLTRGCLRFFIWQACLHAIPVQERTAQQAHAQLLELHTYDAASLMRQQSALRTLFNGWLAHLSALQTSHREP